MKKYLFAILLSLIFLSIHAQNTSPPPAKQSSDLTSLQGEWVVDSGTVSPLMIIPRCKPVCRGTIFRFTENELQVFTNASEKPCDVFRFKIIASKISIIKEDMIWLCTYELNPNLLKIKSNNFFTPYQSDASSSPANKQSTPMQEIEVTLIKKN